MGARATRHVGTGPWLAPLAAALEPLHGQYGVVNPGACSLGAIDGALGGLALAAGDRDSAIRLLTSAANQNRAAGLRPFLALALADLADALSQTQPDEASAHAVEARRLATEIGMAHVIRQLDTLVPS
jgi:hypothetical protein